MKEELDIFCLILSNETFLISKIEEIYADIGKPDCKLIKPFVVNKNTTNGIFLQKWLYEFTEKEEILISSDKILTIVEPKEEILKKYLEIIE